MSESMSGPQAMACMTHAMHAEKIAMTLVVLAARGNGLRVGGVGGLPICLAGGQPSGSEGAVAGTVVADVVLPGAVVVGCPPVVVDALLPGAVVVGSALSGAAAALRMVGVADGALVVVGVADGALVVIAASAPLVVVVVVAPVALSAEPVAAEPAPVAAKPAALKPAAATTAVKKPVDRVSDLNL